MQHLPEDLQDVDLPFFRGCSKLPDDILLIDAATTFWLAMQSRQNAVREMLAPLKVEERKLVLCPLNDSRDTGCADGGSHWGLLVWDRRAIGAQTISDPLGDSPALPAKSTVEDSLVGRFLYYDSGGFLRSDCQLQANRLASKLAGRAVRAIAGTCPKQTNYYDCGMYVLMFSKIIVCSFLQDDTTKPGRTALWEKQLMELTPADVTAHRAAFFHFLKTAES
jgi:sentrin-specific protease 8